VLAGTREAIGEDGVEYTARASGVNGQCLGREMAGEKDGRRAGVWEGSSGPDAGREVCRD
jgi:hypothetical protein